MYGGNLLLGASIVLAIVIGLLLDVHPRHSLFVAACLSLSSTSLATRFVDGDRKGTWRWYHHLGWRGSLLPASLLPLFPPSLHPLQSLPHSSMPRSSLTPLLLPPSLLPHSSLSPPSLPHSLLLPSSLPQVSLSPPSLPPSSHTPPCLTPPVQVLASLRILPTIDTPRTSTSPEHVLRMVCT